MTMILKTNKIFRLLAVMLAIVVTMTCFSVSASAASYGTNSNGWERRPITVYADLSLSSMEISQLQQAINSWNNTKFGTFFVYGGTIGNTQLMTAGNGICGVTKYPFASSASNQIANTLSWRNPTTKYLTKFVITLDANKTFNNGSTSTGDYYLKSILMHELGHGLGLSDSPFSNSVMYGKYTGLTVIISSDIETLDTIY